jgi:hypothetical protein
MRTFSLVKPVLRPGVRYRKDLEGGVIFDAASLGVCFTNPTGLLILDEINSRRSCADIVERLQHRFVSTARRTLRNDLRRFLEDLADLGFVDLQA